MIFALCLWKILSCQKKVVILHPQKMPYMKTKAIDNLESAQILLNNKRFTTSVHCSYYAVLEYMKYMLAMTSDRPISYEKQSETKQDSHEYILCEIQNRISNPKNARNFTAKVRDLKQLRVIADYETKVFSDIEGLDCKSKAEGLIANLKNYFGNL